MKKRYIILIILLILGLSYWAYSKDEPLPKDDDLKLVRIVVPADENAWYPLKQAVENFYLPIDQREDFHDIAEGKKWDKEFVKELLEKNKATLEYFEKAVELPVFQIPPEKIEPDGVIRIRPSPIQDIARLVSIKSAYLFEQGKEKEAFDTAMKLVELGYMIANSQGPYIVHLVGSVKKEIGLTRLRLLIPEINLPSDLLKNYIKKLEQFKRPKQGIISAYKFEYEFFRGILERGAIPTSFDEEKKIPDFPPHRFKPNQTKRIFAETFRFYINNISEPYSKVKEFKHPEVEDFDWDAPKIVQLFSRNFEGKLFYYMAIMPPLGVYYERVFSVTGTQLLLAMRGYQIENRKLPESLEELVPEYFVKVPQDPFDGNYIRYSKEKGIIYSVGRNLKDEGGEGDDLQFLIAEGGELN